MVLTRSISYSLSITSRRVQHSIPSPSIYEFAYAVTSFNCTKTEYADHFYSSDRLAILAIKNITNQFEIELESSTGIQLMVYQLGNGNKLLSKSIRM